MQIYQVFRRLPHEMLDEEKSPEMDDMWAWRERMDQLLLSDPREVASFASDCLISLAAKTKEEYEDSFEHILDLMREAASDDREHIIEMVKGRMDQIMAQYGEHQLGPASEVLATTYHLSRHAPPWPEKELGWMYLSFANDHEWLGAVVVQGNELGSAIMRSISIGIKPGGESPEEVSVSGFPLRKENEFPEEMRNRLLSMEDLELAGYELVRLDELIKQRGSDE